MIIYDYFHDYRKKLQYQCQLENLPKFILQKKYVCIYAASHLE